MNIDLPAEKILELIEGKPCTICFYDKPDGEGVCDGYTNFVITKSIISPIKGKISFSTRTMFDDLQVVIHSDNQLDDHEIKAIQRNPLNFLITGKYPFQFRRPLR